MRAPGGGAAVCLAVALAACGGGEERARPSAPPRRPAAADAGAALDPLGERPPLGDPAPYAPPVPANYKGPNGLTVWLLERHTLPIVAIELVVPAGSAHDPDGKAGAAYMTANMLDEGAGARGPLELSREIDRLGASLQTGVYADYAFVRLAVLKKNLLPAAALFGDVVARPQLSAVEYKRVHDLWVNALRARQSDPGSVASVVVARKVFPPGHPYAHPTNGLLAAAPRVTLDDVKKLYASRWRPDRATCVVVGDVTRPEVDVLVEQVLGRWKAPAAAAPPVDPLPNVPATGRGDRPRVGRKVVIVDRPDAPQSVIAVARPGVAAGEEESPLASRVNAALGGSFTSRLNQDLREEHGWSYGASSRFSWTRNRGLFVAQAAVHTEHTGDALRAMLADIAAIAKGGLTDEEVDRTRKLARADVVEAFEKVDAAAKRLARAAGVGLPPDHEAAASLRAARADKAALDRLAARQLDLEDAVIVVVGPRAKIEPQLKTLDGVTIESSGPEGQ